jgi:hypothetical protein
MFPAFPEKLPITSTSRGVESYREVALESFSLDIDLSDWASLFGRTRTPAVGHLFKLARKTSSASSENELRILKPRQPGLIHVTHHAQVYVHLALATNHLAPDLSRSRNSRYLARLDSQVRLGTLDYVSRVELTRSPVRVLPPRLVAAERYVSRARGAEVDTVQR